jgi:hypothetical protein
MILAEALNKQIPGQSQELKSADNGFYRKELSCAENQF